MVRGGARGRCSLTCALLRLESTPMVNTVLSTVSQPVRSLFWSVLLNFDSVEPFCSGRSRVTTKVVGPFAVAFVD